ncbi:MAG: hypothetical protein ACI9BD_000078 [Candidatus Marinamargulisbacteria bacterium]|jgi:hypothetical protein
MHTITDDYSILCTQTGHATLKGIMRLPSPADYTQPFKYLFNYIEDHNGPFTIDISELQELNSSGLTALARIFIMARQVEVPIVVLGNQNSYWQRKSMSSLQKLWSEIVVKLS